MAMAMRPHFLHLATSKVPNLRIVQLFFVAGLIKKGAHCAVAAHKSWAPALKRNRRFIPRGLVCFRSEHRSWLVFLMLLFSFSREPGWSQCAGVASTPRAAS